MKLKGQSCIGFYNQAATLIYSLHLTCTQEDVDLLSSELWELGTVGIREMDRGDDVLLIAGFDNLGSEAARDKLLQRFREFLPQWELEESVDWVQFTREAWPGRAVGQKLFLMPAWAQDAAPEGRISIVHNPGMASGTGEHPCTQLALIALELNVGVGSVVLDVGTGSGILAIAANSLGASIAIGIDIDPACLNVARENFRLNGLQPALAAGSADCLVTAAADVTIANISGTVLLSILEDLLRITKPGGILILTGFTKSESHFFARLFPGAIVSELHEWCCVVARLSSSA